MIKSIACLKRAALMIAGFSLTCVCQSVAGEPFELYTYHEKPPYFHKARENAPPAPGIYRAFTDYLNRKQPKYNIRLTYLPRNRLEKTLRDGQLSGAILGVNPLWFKDSEETRYLWSQAFMWDQDVIVTRAETIFSYHAPNDLVGKKLALPRGLYFWGVMELAADGKLSIFETSSDLQNLTMVQLQRADATITSILTYQYLMAHELRASGLVALEKPHDLFARRVLFPKSSAAAFTLLAPIIAQSLSDPAWQAELQRFHYEAERFKQEPEKEKPAN